MPALLGVRVLVRVVWCRPLREWRRAEGAIERRIALGCDGDVVMGVLWAPMGVRSGWLRFFLFVMELFGAAVLLFPEEVRGCRWSVRCWRMAWHQERFFCAAPNGNASTVTFLSANALRF